jgi:hypothetical protein
MVKNMKNKQVKNHAWLSIFMAMFIGFTANMASADRGIKNQFPSMEKDFLQFKAGNHVMGFKPDKVYLANTTGFLSVEFLGAHHVTPKATAADTNKNEEVLPQDHGETLSNLRQVEYRDLWDGITLRYDAAHEGISESTYFLQPGADVADIRLQYNADTELQKDGSLKITLSSQQGYITESRPVAWQEFNGRKKVVQVAYEIKDGTIGFKTGDYDKNHELIIDPTYQWHTFHGSSGDDVGLGIAVDGSGNVYVTGYSSASWGSPVNGHSGGIDIVTLKLDSSGTLQWNTFLGAASSDVGRAIAVDGTGNVYVAGYSEASWGSPVNAYSNGGDIVVFKLNSSGALQWNTFQGSTNYDYGYGIAVDGSGNVYATGHSNATWGTPVNNRSGNNDIVALKLNSSGVLQWNTFHGSSSSDSATGIAVDGSGNVYVAGTSDASWGTPVNSHSGSTDIVALKLNSSGVLLWHTFHGSASSDNGQGIAVDGSDNVYVTGSSDGSWGSNVKNAQSGYYDIVVLKLNGSGEYQWNTFHGSAGWDEGHSIAVDETGNIYVTGKSVLTWGAPINPYSGSGASDIMVLKLDNSGTRAWHAFYGSADYDEGQGIAVDGSKNIYVTGFSSASWDTPVSIYNGSKDIVALKLGPYSTLSITKNGTGSGMVTSTPAGIDCGTDCTESYNDSTTVSLTATPDTNFTFTGWSGNCTGTTSPLEVVINADNSCTATFVLNTYTITASAGANGTIGPNGDTTVNHGSDQAFSITPETGYHVADVLVDGTSVGATTSYTFTNVTATHTIAASFAINTYTINASAGANGTIGPNGEATVNHGSDQAFSITPETGYHVADVLVDGTSVGAATSYTFTNVTATHTIAASFAINTYTITASAGTNGTINPNSDTTVNHGSNQAFSITPATNYHVADVLVDGASVGATTSYTFTNVTAKHTIAASFAIDTHILMIRRTKAGTVTSIPTGINCGSDCSENYDHGTDITLNATPAAGGFFIGWSGSGCTGTTECTVTMDSDKEIFAVFQNDFPWPMFLPAITKGIQ